MMKRILFFVVFVLLSGFKTEAQEVALNTGYHSMYLGAQGGNFHGKPVQQTDVTLRWGSGIFATAWGSTGFDTQKNFGKEFDVIVGYASKRGKVIYNVNGAYFVVQGIDVVNTNVELGLGMVFARAEHYQPTQSGGPRKGTIISTGVKLGGMSLFERYERVKLNMATLVKLDSGAFGFDKAWLYQAGFGASIDLGSTDLNLGARWSVPLTRLSDGRQGEIAWSLGLTRTFGH